ncbi:Beta-glucosidase 30, partial [Globisporangium splendens]
MSRKSRDKDEDFGLKKSSGVNYSQVLDRHVNDDRFERQRNARVGATPAPVAPPASSSSTAKKPVAQSATMDAFMRMVTGKDERTIADRISDPNRPTWEQYKKENADKLDLFANDDKEMIAYRKKLDAAREKALAKRSHTTKKKKKRSSSSSDNDSDSDDGRKRSKKKNSRKKKKSRKRRRSVSSDSESDALSGDSDREERSRKRHKHSSKSKKKKSKKASRDRDHSPSPVRLSAFLNDDASSDDSTEPPHAQEPTVSRSDRLSFMKLLRDGVQLRMRRQSGSNLSDASTVSSTAEDEDASSSSDTAAPSKRSTRGTKTSLRAWQTLAWRDVYSTEPFFEETVNGKPLRVKQLLQGELNGLGTGLTVWPAACVLLKHLDHRFGATKQLQNQFVLELGSGTGAVGIAAAMLHARRVVVTDVDNVLFLMQENADLARHESQARGENPITTIVEVASYMWGAPPSEAILPPNAEPQEYPDLILVSDCILPRLYPIEPLVAALALLCKPHAKILISYEHRHYEEFHPKQRFWDLMAAQGFALRVIEDDEYHPHYQADDIEIWEIARKV